MELTVSALCWTFSLSLAPTEEDDGKTAGSVGATVDLTGDQIEPDAKIGFS